MTRSALCHDRYPELSPSEIGRGLHDGSINLCKYSDGLWINLDLALEGMLQRDMSAKDRMNISPHRRCLNIMKLGTCPEGLPVAVIRINDDERSATDTVHICTYCNMAGMCGNPIVNKNLYDLLGDDPVWNEMDDDDD